MPYSEDELRDALVESAQLLGLNPDKLSPADRLRCDLVSTLRSVIDDEQARSLDSGSADLGKLIVAVEALTKLLPARHLEPPPDAPHEDPRIEMFKTYMEMRRRGELVEKQRKAERKPAFERENETLRAENEKLRRRLAKRGEKTEAPSPPSNVVDIAEQVRRNALREAPPPPPSFDYNEAARHVRSDGSISTGTGILGDWSDRRT